MNIFVIPSWYPSEDYPITGIMIAEQYEAICKEDPGLNIGISIWGQMDKSQLLFARDHLKNLRKLLAPKRRYTVSKAPNLKEYHTPTFTWSRTILKGNFQNIVKANLQNLEAFEQEFGTVHLIHAHVGHPAGNIALEVAKQVNKPFCLTERMGPFPSPYTTNKHKVLTEFHKLPYLKSALNIAVSPFQMEMMQSQGIHNIQTIPDFADEHYFQPAPRLIKEGNPFTFFTLTRLEDGKGVEDLLVAYKRVLEQGKKINLRIGGTGQKAQNYQELSERLKIAKEVQWLGDISREHALQEYQQCDAFVLPSYYESFGIVYIEALACGKPVIATECGGPETIVNPTNGLLVEKGNTKALAGALHYMLDNAHKYDPNPIRQDFLNRFSKKAVVPQIINMYKEIINQHKTTP
jgi:glycosyltransferase involved in cell wall biosynthesis